jgi:hypothetical protein
VLRVPVVVALLRRQLVVPSDISEYHVIMQPSSIRKRSCTCARQVQSPGLFMFHSPTRCNRNLNTRHFMQTILFQGDREAGCAGVLASDVMKVAELNRPNCSHRSSARPALSNSSLASEHLDMNFDS